MNYDGIVFVYFISFCFWYVWYGFGYFLNSGTLGRRFVSLMPFDCFWIDFLQNIPGGKKRKIESVKEMIGNMNGCICTARRKWEFEKVRQGNLYDECALDIFPSMSYFWSALFVNLTLPPLVAMVIIGLSRDVLRTDYFELFFICPLLTFISILLVSLIAHNVEKGDDSVVDDIVKILQ